MPGDIPPDTRITKKHSLPDKIEGEVISSREQQPLSTQSKEFQSIAGFATEPPTSKAFEIYEKEDNGLEITIATGSGVRPGMLQSEMAHSLNFHTAFYRHIDQDIRKKLSSRENFTSLTSIEDASVTNPIFDKLSSCCGDIPVLLELNTSKMNAKQLQAHEENIRNLCEAAKALSNPPTEEQAKKLIELIKKSARESGHEALFRDLLRDG
jgi:hypothetical protein